VSVPVDSNLLLGIYLTLDFQLHIANINGILMLQSAYLLPQKWLALFVDILGQSMTKAWQWQPLTSGKRNYCNWCSGKWCILHYF
jgi:hypothetical protein